MRKLLPSLVIFTLTVLSALNTFAQITIPPSASEGRTYTVTLDVRPTALVPSSTSCQYGYNYNVRVTYNVSFGGINPPASMYTLQGTVGCDGSSNFFSLPTNGGSGNTMSTSNAYTNKSDCQTASISSMNCRSVNVTIQGPNLSQRTVSVPQPVVLDVKFTFFDAAVKNSNVSLTWGTATETNNDFFSVERSANGSDWNRIGTVKGNGTTTAFNSYQFTDAAALSGVAYYRIRQVDLDGATTISGVKTIRMDDAAAKISLFPVPNTGNNITVSGIRDFRNYQLAVMTTAGNQVFQTSLTAANVSLPSLAAGFYFIRITENTTGAVTSIRYVKK